MIGEKIFEFKRGSQHQSRLVQPWCSPQQQVSSKTRRPIETTNFDDSNLKYVIGVGDFANVTKQNLKDPEEMLAPLADTPSTYFLECLRCQTPVTDGTFYDKDAALEDLLRITLIV